MDTKSLGRVEIKDAVKGEVTAVFATLGVVDSDGDVTLPGAFDEGASVRISAYGHTSWQGALPVGKGTIRTVGNEAILDGQFFMDTTAGRDTFTVVQELGADQEWSYGYDSVEFSFGEQDGRPVRFLAKQKVYEVSPVLLGAGVGTRVLTAKSAAVGRPRKAIRSHETPVVSKSWDGYEAVKSIPEDTRPSDLRSVYAWVDPDTDPEAKGSYRFPHHHGIGGSANVRACLAGIATLNSTKAGVPDGDRLAVYDHLAAHLRDADREFPELRTGPSGGLKFNDELLEGLAGLSGLIDNASRVVALRASKGKTLSKVNAEILEWIADDLKRLDALLTNPPAGAVSEEEIDSLFLASLAAIHDL